MLDLEPPEVRLTDNVVHTNISVMEVTLAQAAQRLHVSAREAQRLAAAGQLNVVRQVGRTLLVDDAAVTALERRARRPGRTWDANTAWAAIELLDHGSTSRLSGSSLSRLRRRLRELSVPDLVRLASHRAAVIRCDQTRRSKDRLKEQLVLGGVSALDDPETSTRFGLVSSPSVLVEGYVERPGWTKLQEDFGLYVDAEGQAVIRIADVEPFGGDVTTALDLVERGSTRERSAAERHLRSALSTWRTARPPGFSYTNA
jgi:hypothetical protein